MMLNLKRIVAQWLAGGVNRLFSAWTQSPIPIDEEIKAQLRSLRARSRERSQNSDTIRSYLRLLRANVVGDLGIQLQSVAETKAGKPDEQLREAIENGFERWGKPGSCEATGRMGFKRFCRHVITMLAQDGEAFIRKLSLPYNRERFVLELLDPELIDVAHNASGREGQNDIQMGVELDQWRRPVAYHVLNDRKTASTYMGLDGRRRVRIPAEEIYHLFDDGFIWQTRGVPWCASTLPRIKLLDEYTDAEVAAARHGAERIGFFTDETGRLESSGDTDANGFALHDTEIASMWQLPPGVAAHPWESQHPKPAFADFVKAIKRDISGGLGVSYNSIANDLEGVNLSSLRHGQSEERQQWKIVQADFIEGFVERVAIDWLDAAVRAGTLTIRGKPIQLTGFRLEQARRFSWQPPRWPWMDPDEEVSAHEKEVALRLNSRRGIMREKGRDPDVIWAELEAEEARFGQRQIQSEIGNDGNQQQDSE